MLSEIPRTAANPEVPRITAEEASAAARASIMLFEKWHVGDAVAREILGGLSSQKYAHWKAGGDTHIGRDLATRLSLLIGIHAALRILFGRSGRRYVWIKRPNDAFGGRTPLEIMAEGSIFSLARVRSYLEAECQGW